jgi:hypothetical protein
MICDSENQSRFGKLKGAGAAERARFAAIGKCRDSSLTINPTIKRHLSLGE